MVCYTSLGNNRHAAAQDIYESLVQTGFNGHFLLLAGGYPCPTGTEMRYAGVPYAFKIFAMLEAEKRGFQRVLWVDAACIALRNPQPLFDYLTDRPTIYRWFHHNQFGTYAGCVLPQALDLLGSTTAANVRGCRKVCAMIFGLHMTHPLVRQFIRDYYTMVEAGLPFFSLYPEEVVISCILAKPMYAGIISEFPAHVSLFANDSWCSYDHARGSGVYFMQRAYKGAFADKT